MPNIYIKDKTKILLELICKGDKRTQDGEIDFLLSERAKELSIPLNDNPSLGENSEDTEDGKDSQGEKSEEAAA